MTGSDAQTRQPSVARAAVVYLLAFTAVGAWVPYWTVFVQSLGVGLGTIGLLAGVSAAATIVAAPAWGAAADRFGDVRGPLLVASIWTATAAAALSLSTTPPLIAIEIAFLSLGSAGIVPLVDSRTLELLGVNRDRFGRVRAVGSVAFIVSSVVVGMVVERQGPSSLFLVFCPTLVLVGIVAAVLLGRSSGRRNPVNADVPSRVGLLRDGRLAAFFGTSVLVWTSSSAVIAFFSLRLIEIGADAALVGTGWAVNAVVEVPLMLAFPLLVRRAGAERLLIIGAGAFAFRALGFAVSDGLPTLIAVSAMGGVGFALFFVGSVTYVARVAPPEARATAQGLFSGTAFATGTIIGTTLGGAIAGSVGLQALFAACTALSAFAAAAVWWAVIGRGRDPRANQPAGPSAGSIDRSRADARH